ncbi:MurR/RpiR family transcriptional regulator [Halomonas sp. YLGW01]|uniref:MurR/RpiR family transcriptional regulator n=1 Tax=Halomonas sp. YLGW01 TaxID=2773308 RepID=UPI0017833CD3|nr:MurR/RpiR family transcriptional regulator [Halomonas sp. YLGW01]
MPPLPVESPNDDQPASPLPPSDLSTLARLVEAARRGDRRFRGMPIPKLSARAMTLLESFLAQPHQVGLNSISALADDHGVNASTLTRLCKALHFEGYKSFQGLFREDLADSSFYSSRAQRLIGDIEPTPASESVTASDDPLYLAERDNIDACLKGLDPEALEAACSQLLAARRIHVVGLRASFAAAHYLAYYLDYLRDGVELIASTAGVDVERVLDLDERDCVIAIAFRPESRATLAYARAAADQGTPIIGLTNHPRGEVPGLSNRTLVAPASGPFFFNPMGSLFLLVEMLLSRLSTRLGQDAIKRIRRREALIARRGVE